MKKFIYTALSFSPILALAQNIGQTTNALQNAVGSIRGFINNALIPLMFAVAIVFFFWGLVQYVRSAGDPDKTKEARSHMIWGIVALVAMVSVYGLINWLASLIGLQGSSAAPVLPQI